MAVEVHSIGRVESTFTDSEFRSLEAFSTLESAIVLSLEHSLCLDGLCERYRTAHVLYLLDRIAAPHLLVHPRGDVTRPQRGVFSTRSPTRPNRVALTTVELVSRPAPNRLVVRGLDALDGSPILDIHPAEERRN